MRRFVLGISLVLVATGAEAQRGGLIVGGDGVFDPPTLDLCQLFGGSPPESVWRTDPLPPPEEPASCEVPACGGVGQPPCGAAVSRPGSATLRGQLVGRLGPLFGRYECYRPSVTQCEDPAFMGRCGESAITGCAVHAEALEARYGDRWASATQGEVQVGHASGALGAQDLFEGDDLSLAAVDPSVLPGVFQLDPSSYRSHVDLLEYWNRNGGGFLTLLRMGQMSGLPVRDCFEYVHERYYDISNLELRTLGSSPRQTFDAAYAPDGLAREQLCAPDALRSLDDVDVFGQMFPDPVLRNAFHVLFLAEAALDYDGDSLAVPQELIEFVDLQVPRDSETVQPSWLWHALQSRQMRQMKRLTDATIRPSSAYPCGATRTHGYTDEELNYLYDLQQRYQFLLSQLRYNTLRPDLIPEHLPNDWIGNAVNPVSDEQSVAALQRDIRASAGASGVIGGGLGDALDPRRYVSNTDADLVQAIFAQEASLGAEILEVLKEAEAWGCLQRDVPTPCDWSPKLFTELVQNRFKVEQEAAFDECEQFVSNPTNFSQQWDLDPTMNATNLVYATGSPESATYATLLQVSCAARALERDDAGNELPNTAVCDRGATTFPYSGNHWWSDGNYATTATRIGAPKGVDRRTFISRSREHSRLATRGLILKTAGELLDEAPELLDEATGTLRRPEYAQSVRETLGNSFFSVDYGWEYAARVRGFDSDESADTDLCHANALTFEGGMKADANVSILGVAMPDPLVSARADGYAMRDVAGEHPGDEDQGVDVQVSVAGIEVYATEGRVAYVDDGGGSRDFGRGEIPSYDAWFSVLGVPIHVQAGATVTAGVDADADVSWSCEGDATVPAADLLLTITPSLEAKGYASAAVDAGIARAGIKGSLTLIGIGLPIVFDMAIEDGEIVLSNGVDLQLSTLQGRLAVFAEVGAGPFSLDAEKTLVEWGGVTRNEPLLHITRHLPIAKMSVIPWGRRI